MKDQSCRVCGSNKSEVVYDGPIRSGGVGSEFVDGYTYRQCLQCTFVFIDPVPENLEEFYKSEEYRLKFHNEKEVSGMQAKYDHEQDVRVTRIGIKNVRNKTVADFGAGAGLFLDCVKGVAKKTVAIEPAEDYQKHLKAQGHACYSYIEDLKNANEIFDVATSFDAIEHVYDINNFVGGIYQMLAEDGTFYLSMPQHNDMARLLCSEKYESFFYQMAHLNYFNAKTIGMVLKKAGFKDIKIGYLHKYDMRNILQWAKYGKPGAVDTSVLDEHFHAIYIQEIERLRIASHLFVTVKK